MESEPTARPGGDDAPAAIYHVVEHPWQSFEDLRLDERFDCGGFTLSAEEIIAFARKYDPQGHHIDPAQARASLVGGLFGSAIHTFAASVGIVVRSMPALRIAIGLELRAIELPSPLLPDMPYRVSGHWALVRPSGSRPEVGIARWEAETRTEAGALVMRFGSTLMVRRAATGQRET